jgi:hypothetical protein
VGLPTFPSASAIGFRLSERNPIARARFTFGRTTFQLKTQHQQLRNNGEQTANSSTLDDTRDSMMQSIPSAVVPIPGGNGVRGISDLPSPTSTSTPPGISPNSSHNPGLNSSGGRPRRPRSRRDKDKRFTCDFEGCDKTYTRAEHLTRHQLNRKCFLCPVVFSFGYSPQRQGLF